MNRKIQLLKFAFLLSSQLIFLSAHAQCTWHTFLFDSYEYQTACPDIIPGTYYTGNNIPQSYAVHSGTYSLYMNFVTYNGSTGTNAGAVVYQRVVSVCPNTPIRISSWLTTSFAGTQCNMQMKILDSNNVVLDSTASILAPYSPLWTKYQSLSVTPTTTTISFVIITNVAGGGGNDLSMDDFLIEQCSGLNLGSDTTLCNTDSITLDAGTGFTSYLWNNGSTSQTLTASTTSIGTVNSIYSIEVGTSAGCNFIDSIHVLFDVCTSLNEMSNTNQFVIYPNPVSDHLTVTSTELFKNTYFVLSDIFGRELLRIKTENLNQPVLLTPDIGNGIYLYQISDGKSQGSFGKLVVNKP